MCVYMKLHARPRSFLPNKIRQLDYAISGRGIRVRVSAVLFVRRLLDTHTRVHASQTHNVCNNTIRLTRRRRRSVNITHCGLKWSKSTQPYVVGTPVGQTQGHVLLPNASICSTESMCPPSTSPQHLLTLSLLLATDSLARLCTRARTDKVA